METNQSGHPGQENRDRQNEGRDMNRSAENFENQERRMNSREDSSEQRTQSQGREYDDQRQADSSAEMSGRDRSSDQQNWNDASQNERKDLTPDGDL